jgi:hypothetical protein
MEHNTGGVMITYFPLARALARAEGARTIAAAALKSIALKSRRTEVCCCSAYDTPHRPGCGECPAPSGAELNDISRQAAARAYHSGAW